jgi:hypothetical protein
MKEQHPAQTFEHQIEIQFPPDISPALSREIIMGGLLALRFLLDKLKTRDSLIGFLTAAERNGAKLPPNWGGLDQAGLQKSVIDVFWRKIERELSNVYRENLN